MWYVTFKLNVFNICIEFCLKIDLKKLNHTFGDLKFLTDPLVQLHVSSRVQLGKIFGFREVIRKHCHLRRGVWWGGGAGVRRKQKSLVFIDLFRRKMRN